jgi:hypothetical protein
MRKRHLVVLTTLLLAFATPLRACDDEEAQAYLIDEILRLSHEGVPDRIIIKQMRTMNFVFCLNADDIIELRELGVSDDILEALIETSLEVEDSRREDRVVVRVSPGYWSPWYRYPTGWGAYYDPFPYQFSWNYYPFLYSCGYWYGWSPDIYYYTYHLYDVHYDYSPHRGDYRDEAPQYVVKRNRGAVIVDNPLTGPLVAEGPIARSPVVVPPVTAGERGILRDRVDSATINVRGPYRSATVVTPPLRASGGNQRTLTEARSDVLNVRNPSTLNEASLDVPRSQPLTPAREAQPPVVDRSRPPATERRDAAPAERPERIVPRRGTPAQVTPPTRREASSVTRPPSRTSTPARVTPPAQRPAPARVTPSSRQSTPTRVTPPPTRVAPSRPAPRLAAPPPRQAAPASKPPTAKRSR